MDVPGEAPTGSADDYGASARAQFFKFLREYTRDDAAMDENSPPHYVQRIREMVFADQKTLFVDCCDLEDFDPQFADTLKDDYIHLEPFLNEAVQQLVEIEEGLGGRPDEQKGYLIGFYGLRIFERLRDLRAEAIGRLVTFTGTVTRTSEVRPQLHQASFTCRECKAVIKGVQQEFKLTFPNLCTTQGCGNRKDWTLMKDESTFVDWQRVKVQETNDEIPAGCLPRTMEVILRNDLVEQIRPGDFVTFTGTLIAIPDVSVIAGPGERITGRPQGEGMRDADGVLGLPGLGVRELKYRLSFMACSAQSSSERDGMINIRSEDDLKVDEIGYSDEQLAEVQAMGSDPYIYRKLAHSISPNVWGSEDIKKAILLMLVGGVHKKTHEGISLRGDINVCIVGDPSCGKSQMLKYVAGFLPRAVYTSGKSSSAAGLTACVVKEADGSGFAIEAGALMLADNGICCIDEFDKMDLKDQVAIHETMEQQTISLSKGGIQATLNSRASILAAANPLLGRYDKSRPLKTNVALPPALLSRFDLLHIMVDEPDDILDNKIGSHIIATHIHAQANEGDDLPPMDQPPFSREQMQLYIKYCRCLKPEITPAVKITSDTRSGPVALKVIPGAVVLVPSIGFRDDFQHLFPKAKRLLTKSYIALRESDALPGSKSAYRITVRQLEALIRLSEALARLHLCEEISVEHVQESRRLLENSINTLDAPDMELEDLEGIDDPGPGRFRAALEEENLQTRMQEEPARAEGVLRDRSSDPVNMPLENGRPHSKSQSQTRVGSQGESQTGRITQQAFETTKRILVSKLRQHEEEVLEQGDEGTASSGMTQKDLLAYYFESHLIQRMRKTPAEARVDMKIAKIIVGMLIHKENVLLVLHSPTQREGETSEQYLTRKRDGRILAVNPNYADPS